MFVLWVMGCIYNIPPVRSKDLPYLDVLSEAVNNPLRMLAGWAAGHAGGDDAGVPRHAACGSALAARWYCPTCERPVGTPEGPVSESGGGPAPGDGLVWV